MHWAYFIQSTFCDCIFKNIGSETGVILAIEFASENTIKKNNKSSWNKLLKYSYSLPCSSEDLVCEPEIDDSWLEFEVNDLIDGQDRWYFNNSKYK